MKYLWNKNNWLQTIKSSRHFGSYLNVHFHDIFNNYSKIFCNIIYNHKSCTNCTIVGQTTSINILTLKMTSTCIHKLIALIFLLNPKRFIKQFFSNICSIVFNILDVSPYPNPIVEYVEDVDDEFFDIGCSINSKFS